MLEKFRTTEEILKGDVAHEVCEELEELHSEKLKQFFLLNPGPPADYRDPHITEVERNFSIVLEWERGFAMGGSPKGFNQSWKELRHCWAAVGMEKSALEMKLIEHIKDIEQKIYDMGLPETDRDEISDSLSAIHSGIEEIRVWEDHSEALVAYVAANLDQFCKRDENGQFV